MPLYEYKCHECGCIFEMFFNLKDWDTVVVCKYCSHQAAKQLHINEGGMQDDHPVWLDESIRRQIQDTDNPNEEPITSRLKYKQHLKDTGIEPKS